MSQTRGGLELLIAAGNRSFGSAVADAVEATGEAAVTSRVETARRALAQSESEDVDGVVVDDRLAEPATVVDRLTSERDLPVVVLTDPTGNGDRVSQALEAGATDVFPRTTTTEQYELVVDRIASERNGSPSPTDGMGHDQPYREVFESGSDGMVIHDPETGEIVDANERYCEMTGFSREELVGETVGLVTADDPEYSVERAGELIQRARDEGSLLFEWRNKHRDGDAVPVEVHLTLVELRGEERVLASVRDITERKRRERDYEEIFNKVSDAIAVFDPETGSFVDINDSYREMFGYDDLETIRELGIDGLSASTEGYTGERGAQLIREVSESGEGKTVEWRGETRSGERFWIEATLAPAEIGGKQRVLSIQRDITERRELERTYQDIFESVSDGLVVHDPESGDILEVNDRYCEITGYDREELLDETIGVIIPDDPEWTYEDALERIRRAREDGLQLFEFKGQRRDGGMFVGEIHLSTIKLRGEERVLASVRDITERKRREREYEQIFNGVQDAITVHDPDTGEMVNVNDAFCDLVGYDREKILEMGTVGVSVEEEGYTEEYAEEIIAEVLREERKGPYEWMVETKDGDRRVTEVVATKGELGGAVRIISSNRDITERKRREREYEQIFNMAGDGIIIHDPESGDIVDANQQVADLLGYDRRAFFDRPLSEFQATDEGVSGQQAREKIQESVATGGQEFEWPLETSDGETVWVRARHETGRIDGEQRVVALLHDITERRRREQEFQQVFNSVNDIIAVHDGDTGELVNVNRRMCELTGYEKERVLERGAEGLVRDHPDQEYAPEEISTIIERVMGGEEVQPYEQVLETRDGELIWIEVNPTRAVIGGEERFVAISRDITERRRREREYEQIFSGVKDSIAVWDPETLEILDVNEAYLEMFGYESREELREQGVSGLSVTEEGYTEQRGKAIHQRVAESGESETVVWQGETSGGERLWTEVKVTPAVIGSEQRTVSIQRDITERKRREQMIRSLYDATERLQRAETTAQTCQTAVEVAGDALDLPLTAFWLHRETDDGPVLEPVAETEAVQDLDPLWFRPGDEAYEAFSQAEMRVHDPSEQFPENPLDASIVLPVGEHGLLAAGRVGVEEYDEFVVDAARTLAGHVRTALDRVEREQAVRESERRFRLIAERIDEVIYLTEPDFSEMLYVNPAYEEVFGQPIETLYDDATAFLTAIDERDRASFESDFEEMLTEIDAGEPAERYEFEFRIRKPDSEVRWVHATGYAVELSGESPRFVGIVDDITQRKRREQRLEVFNRILRHNLRNQLDVIRSHAEVLADQHEDDHADRIITAADELAGMGTRARRSDRIMAMDERQSRVDISEILRDTLDVLAPVRDDIGITTQIPESAPLTTSEDAVTVAVENAVKNAIEHGNSSVSVTIEDSQEGYHIVIDDDGPGIPKEELAPIEAGTETKLRHGRGLGLWQLRWSVDKINGELSFDTTAGTTVTLTVPDQDGSDRTDD